MSAFPDTPYDNMKTWHVKRTDTDGLEKALNKLTGDGYEIFSINTSPKPGFSYNEYVISAYKESE